jgi:hypothetical protein
MTNQYAPPKATVGDVSSGGAITNGMIASLGGTKTWVLLIGILLFIGAGFMVIAGLGMMAGGAAFGAQGSGGMIAVMGLLYIVLALLYIFPGIYLVKYSSAISRLVASGQTTDMESALDYQRKFWKFTGIIACIMLVFFVIGILAAISIPAFLATR